MRPGPSVASFRAWSVDSEELETFLSEAAGLESELGIESGTIVPHLTAILRKSRRFEVLRRHYGGRHLDELGHSDLSDLP